MAKDLLRVMSSLLVKTKGWLYQMSISNNESHDFYNFRLFVSNLSIIGLGYSTCAAFFSLVIKKATWSVHLIVYIAMPFIFLSLIYAIISIYIGYHYNIRIPYVSQKFRIFFLIFAALLSLLTFLLWENNNAPKMLNIKELSTIQGQHDDELYFVIFKSKNCTYCSQMEDLYLSIIKNNPSVSFYYIDLTYVSLFDETVVAHNIKSIPSIIAYKGYIEIDRLEGLASPEMLQALVTNTGGG